MSFSRILIHSDDVAQANRLSLLLSRYGHDPLPASHPDPLRQPADLNGAMVDCRQLTAEWRVLCMALAQRGLPVVLFSEQLPEHLQEQLMDAGVLLVPHRLLDKEPVEAWIKQARSQQAMLKRQQEAMSEMSQKLEARKLIERAKGLLMQQHQLSEDAAFATLRKSAMQHGLSMGELARRLLHLSSERQKPSKIK